MSNRRLISTLFVAGCAAGLVYGGHASPASADGGGGCKSVKGTFTAQNLPPEACNSPVGFCTEGELKGNLKGQYEFVMSGIIPAGEADVPDVTFFKGDSIVTTHHGEVLEGIDTGSINLEAPGLMNSGRFSTLLTFTDGGAGHLWIHGTSDLAAGTVSGSYSGLVCVD
jgi:hypothetical protein